MSSSVVLPHPEGPMTANNSPARHAPVMPRKIVRRPAHAQGCPRALAVTDVKAIPRSSSFHASSGEATLVSELIVSPSPGRSVGRGGASLEESPRESSELVRRRGRTRCGCGCDALPPPTGG